MLKEIFLCVCLTCVHMCERAREGNKEFCVFVCVSIDIAGYSLTKLVPASCASISVCIATLPDLSGPIESGLLSKVCDSDLLVQRVFLI